MRAVPINAVPLLAALALAGSIASTPALSAGSGDVYTAGNLLSPCQEADNDARWGEAAETECEQYILGFVHALKVAGGKSAEGICPPATNTADEVRWAFMRWVHASYSKRTKIPAPDAMMAMLKSSFACKK